MQSYLHYLEQVLGLTTVVLPPQAAIEVAEVTKPRFQVLFVSEKPLSAQAIELFQKMREAMKLSAESVQVVAASQMSVPELQVLALQAERVVCFSKPLADSLSIEPQYKFHTYSPEEMLSNPQLKKQAWEDLKQVMKSLGVL